MADSGDSAATIAAAREREKRLRSITRTAPDAIVIIDEAGTIDTVNPAAERLFGYSGAELVGQNVKILMPSPHREAHDSHLARYRETGEKRVIGIGRVVVGRRKDGTTFPARLAIGEIELDQGRLFTGFLHDITERETIQRRAGILQQELMHASRLSAMGEMASGIAHELNQPLTAVMNYTRAARRRLDRPEADPAPVADLVDKAGKQAERAAEIIKRLRRFIKKDDSGRRLEPINAVVEEAAALALIGASDRHIELIFSLDDALPPVLMDRIEVQQVVLNILRNAIEAFEGAGERKVRISTQAVGTPAGASRYPGQRPRTRSRHCRRPVPPLPDHQGGRYGHRPRHQPHDHHRPRRPALGREPAGGRRRLPLLAARRR